MARLVAFSLILVASLLAFRSDTIFLRSPTSEILVLYVGAEDCAPCRAWQAGDGAAFRHSEYFAHLTYREVKSPHLLTVLSDDNWPEDVRAYREKVRRDDGVPLWFVVADRVIIQQGSGSSQWQERVLPTIKWLLQPQSIQWRFETKRDPGITSPGDQRVNAASVLR